MPGILKIHLLYDQKHLDVILGQCTNANDVERRRNDTDLAIINALLDQGRCNCPMASCIRQEAMENFVFPDENKTKLIKMSELMNICPILTGIPQKKVRFLFTLENHQKGLYVLN